MRRAASGRAQRGLEARLAFAALLASLVGVAACAGPTSLRRPEAEPFRLADAAGTGDSARRASVDLVMDGLEAESLGGASLAQGRFETAIQVDPGNPYAYLALARHHLDAARASRAIAFLDRAESLLEAEKALSPGLRAHLLGLRGVALERLGRHDEGAAMLAEARELAPSVWNDGRLAPDELL